MDLPQKVALLAAIGFFMVGLLTGVWKYVAIHRSPEAKAPNLRGYLPSELAALRVCLSPSGTHGRGEPATHRYRADRTHRYLNLLRPRGEYLCNPWAAQRYRQPASAPASTWRHHPTLLGNPSLHDRPYHRRDWREPRTRRRRRTGPLNRCHRPPASFKLSAMLYRPRSSSCSYGSSHAPLSWAATQRRSLPLSVRLRRP